MIYKPIEEQEPMCEEGEGGEEELEEEPTQQPEEKPKQNQIIQYTQPYLRFDFEIKKDLVVSMLATGETSEEARQSFCLLIELLNEKISLNNKEPKSKKESYIG